MKTVEFKRCPCGECSKYTGPVFKDGSGVYLPLTEAEQLQRERDEAMRLLKDAQQFIRNGVEYGFIRMPDNDTLDPAHDTLPNINAFLSRMEVKP